MKTLYQLNKHHYLNHGNTSKITEELPHKLNGMLKDLLNEAFVPQLEYLIFTDGAMQIFLKGGHHLALLVFKDDENIYFNNLNPEEDPYIGYRVWEDNYPELNTCIEMLNEIKAIWFNEEEGFYKDYSLAVLEQEIEESTILLVNETHINEELKELLGEYSENTSLLIQTDIEGTISLIGYQKTSGEHPVNLIFGNGDEECILVVKGTYAISSEETNASVNFSEDAKVFFRKLKTHMKKFPQLGFYYNTMK